MIESFTELEQRVLRLKTNKSGERRSPHKPLLLMYAVSQLLQGNSSVSYVSVQKALRPLLDAYAPPVSNRHQPELPYWHLRTDGIWTVSGEEDFPRQRGGFPQKAALRESAGQLTPDVTRLLLENKDRIPGLIQALLDEHFPPSLHEDIVAAIGLEQSLEDCVAEESAAYRRKARDPRFREKVLRAYEHYCVVSGFRASLGGSYFGCEAAHVQWHAFEGPDTVANGMALNPTLHKLFDVGAWTLSDERRVIVSADFTGTESAVRMLREYHGKPIREPLPGEPLVSLDYIKWHREPELGGVFRGPPLHV